MPPVTPPPAAVDRLRAAFEAFTIAEVNQYNGIPHLTREEIDLRAAIAELLAGVPPDPFSPTRLLLASARTQWSRDIAKVLHELATFAASVGEALGDVSVVEAKAAWKTLAREAIEKV